MCRECPSGTSYSQLMYLLEINCYPPPPPPEFKEFFQAYVLRYEIRDVSYIRCYIIRDIKHKTMCFFKIGRAVEKK